MKHKSTILLFVAVAIAGVVAYSLSRKPTSEELSQQRRRVLKDFKASDITSVTIEKDGKRLVCRREDGGDWRITEPVDVRADRYELQDMLDAFAAANMISSPAFPKPGQALNMSVYGLDKPVTPRKKHRKKADAGDEGETDAPAPAPKKRRKKKGRKAVTETTGDDQE